jgi:hypothetical protein
VTPLFELSEVDAKALARAEWRARFERADWVAPWDTASGMKTGDRKPGGWVCPGCGDIEPNEFLLGTNHGYHPDQPGSSYRYAGGPWFGETCVKLELQAAHKIYNERRAMIRHLVAEGLEDEQIADRIGWWDAKTVAGYRKDDAKAARLAARAARGEKVTVGHGDSCPCAYCGGPCTCETCEAFRKNPF